MAIQRFCLGLVGCLLVGCLVVAVISVSRNDDSDVSRTVRQTTGTKPVELVGGKYPWEGRVFIRGPGGKYGSVCNSYLTTNDRNVICKSIYNHDQVKGSSSPILAFGGSVENNVMSGGPRCLGTETNFLNCPGVTGTWVDKSVCIRGEAAVNCQANTPVRLSGGTKPYIGRLEVYTNSSYGSVCNHGFTSGAARTVCDKLGYWYTRATVTSAASYGKFTGPIQLQNLKCSGNEPDIALCTWDPAQCNHTMDVGINCQQLTLSSSYIRLTDGTHPWQGRVEVIENYSRHQWSSICSHSWTTTNTKVACTNLGYKFGGSVLSPMPEAITKVHLNRFSCKGTENNLGLCQGYFMRQSYDCGAYPPNTAAIDCSGGVQARLVDGKLPMEGRVEILNAGKWATVDSTKVQKEEAEAICATLGYQSTDQAQVLAANTFGKGPTTSVISSLTCGSRPKHLAQCTIGTPASNARPSHAAIRCFNCSTAYTQERGTILSPGYPNSASENTDCLYHIAPTGTAQLYKLTVSSVQLGFNDMIEVKLDPLSAPVMLFKGANSHPDMVLFKKEVYIRFKTACCGPRHFIIRWEPITLESTVRLSCTDEGMDVKVNITELRWLYLDTNPAYISLINEGCTGSYLGDTWHINNQHSQCFTSRVVDANRITYKNALIYKEIGSGPIVREHRWRVDLECAFTRNVKVSQQYTVSNQFNYQNNLTSIYQAEMHMYNDSTLAHEMSFEPIRARLGDDLYVKVNLKGNWNVTMRLQGCIGKPSPNSTISYALIHNGCSTDSETHVVYEDPATALFHFKAFEFYAGFSTVYLSCDVKFCAPSDASSACHWKCSTNTGKRDTSGVKISKDSDYTVTKHLMFTE